jgi:hypothetical protein
MDKLKLIGRNLGRVVHSRLGCTCIGHAIVHTTKQPNLNLITRPKQLLGYLPLAFALPALALITNIILSWDKHSSLFCLTINNGKKDFIMLTPWTNVIKLFIATIYIFSY